MFMLFVNMIRISKEKECVRQRDAFVVFPFNFFLSNFSLFLMSCAILFLALQMFCDCRKKKELKEEFKNGQ